MLLGIYSERWKLCLHENLHTKVYSSLIHNPQDLEVTKMFLSRWMAK